MATMRDTRVWNTSAVERTEMWQASNFKSDGRVDGLSFGQTCVLQSEMKEVNASPLSTK